MRSSKKQERCIRTISLTIVISACISITVFIFLQFSGRETNLKDDIPKGNLFQSDKLTDENCIPVCDSRNCITQANILLRSIKPSIDPCENFLNFLCGSYEEKFGSNESALVASEMAAKMRNKLKNIIENIEAEPGSASAKLKTVYDTCINAGSEVEGIETFRQILNSLEIFQWPHLAPNFTFSDAGLPILLGTLRSYGELKFITFRVDIGGDTDSMEKYTKVIIFPPLINAYSDVERDAVADILKYFEIEPEDVETILNDHEAVKKSLISYFEDVREKCQMEPGVVRINCASPGENGWAYLCEAFQVYLNVTELQQYVNTIGIAVDCAELKNLIPHLKTLSHRSVANYFALDFLWHHVDEVGFYFRRKKLKYFEYFKKDDTMTTTLPFNNKWEYCIAWLQENMKDILENEFLKSYLTRAYVDEIHDMHQNFTSAVVDMITHQEWIPFLSKAFMKKYIKGFKCNMEQQLFPNDTIFDDLLKTFNPTKSFLRNTLGYFQSIINGDTRHRHILSEKYQPEFTANAAAMKKGFFEFAYGLFQPPIYYPDHKKFVNPILFAPIAVHEIGHNIVFLLDQIKEISNETREIYLEKSQCIKNQFSKLKFRHLGENLNGTKYVEENLSDNLGFAVTDNMIKELWSSDEVFLLPGLQYSPEQLLFMSSRQAYCAKSSRESDEMYSKADDPHAPQEYRMIGGVQNSKAYSEIFCCPEGSYMNPTEKCTFLDDV